MPAGAGAQTPRRACSWPLYQQFLSRFVQDDGRVIDLSVREQHSTSEGQSYTMLFALIANDRATFDKAWRWSVAHLGGGTLVDKLPAWRWGRRDDGSWGVIDTNSASDADLWYAYALAEAARVWNAPAYAEAARALLRQVAKYEVVTLPRFGPMLLPGPQGFVLANADGSREWRVNASYLPVPLLRRLAAFDPAGPWGALAEQVPKLIEAVAVHGIVPDWSTYRVRPGEPPEWIIDPDSGDISSYDAVRVYLWAGITPGGDAAARKLMKMLAPVAQRMHGRSAPPENMHAVSGAFSGEGPLGFSAALVPFLLASGSPEAAAQRSRAQGLVTNAAAKQNYYDTVLGLFGLGHADGYYHFVPSGQLELAWLQDKTGDKACPRE
ncbi:cellulose synthase complex periplasmic endoglucanase BcsZ [Cupriavidus sp. WKF15]|uniref:cellulose synthase complex periplasmic endoglucanase BcsZ n=1 Tax=Cupriavidus sp. WKF15 TaxID=3032282 RepID=UPI0023E16ED2|nr:cellulose synthase complex periplasmic endoglucanase BcsZ [Cupriavidus sp. WKF15]WER47316.1 cellulose synthase complex periplasmic endoglucanase BcsZ [Cupriavidus sp. WKF15]